MNKLTDKKEVRKDEKMRHRGTRSQNNQGNYTNTDDLNNTRIQVKIQEDMNNGKLVGRQQDKPRLTI